MKDEQAKPLSSLILPPPSFQARMWESLAIRQLGVLIVSR
jgi:hypothetical protein